MSARLRLVLDRDDVTEYAENLGYSNVDPGGYENASFEFPRRVAIKRGLPVKIFDSNELVWDGRVNEPGHSLVELRSRVSCVGNGAKLKDDQMSMIFVDSDLSHWGDISREREDRLIAAGFAIGSSRTGRDDTNGLPSIVQSFRRPGDASPNAEILYDSGPENLIDKAYYEWENQNITNADATYAQQPIVHANDDLTGSEIESGTDHAGSASGTTYWEPAANYRYMSLIWRYASAVAASPGADRMAYWKRMTIYGPHGLTLRGTSDPLGLWPSDIARFAAARAGVPIAYVEDSTGFVTHQAAYRDRVEHEQIVAEMAKLLGWHYGTWADGFHFRRRPTSPTAVLLRDEADDLDVVERLDDLYDTIKVRFADARRGSGVATVSFVDDELSDAGINRTLTVDLGTATEVEAETYGRFIYDIQKLKARATGSLITKADAITVSGGRRGAHTLRAGIDKLKIPDLPDHIYSTEGLRYDEFQIARVSVAVGRDITTTIELGRGADLLDVLNARLAQAAEIVGG
jgi:hypothetical protein